MFYVLSYFLLLNNSERALVAPERVMASEGVDGFVNITRGEKSIQTTENSRNS